MKTKVSIHRREGKVEVLVWQVDPDGGPRIVDRWQLENDGQSLQLVMDVVDGKIEDRETGRIEG